jgi:hypothetical protein
MGRLQAPGSTWAAELALDGWWFLPGVLTELVCVMGW